MKLLFVRPYVRIHACVNTGKINRNRKEESG